MMEVFKGQCQCAEVSYEVHGFVATAFVCHCADCQKQSASAFGMALWIAEPKLLKLNGAFKQWTRVTPSGKQLECTSCAVCGSRLFHKAAGQNAILSIKPGTLLDTKFVQPVAHIWTKSKQPWVMIPDGVLQYEENPESYEPLFEKWRQLKSLMV